MPDDAVQLTTAQQAAVDAAGTSLLVSAAAGAGKTRVLTERVLRLVAAPPSGGGCDRCDLDRLLVVTFTDAAATQMRSRIAGGLRNRVLSNPADRHLRRQLALLDVAQIATIHSFCNRLIREHYAPIGLDPSARVMDADEATLLKHECAEKLFSALYEAGDESGGAFRRLLDVYYLGDDGLLARFLLELHDFVQSLVEPAAWLDRAVEHVRVTGDAPRAAIEHVLADELVAELHRQSDECRMSLELIGRCWPAWADYPEPLKDLLQRLDQWKRACASRRSAAAHDAVRREIVEYKFPRLPRSGGGKDDAVRQRVQRVIKRTKDRFQQKLVDRLCRAGLDDRVAGLRAVEPFVATLCNLITRFAELYEQAKRSRRLLDFADLERKALAVLSQDGDASRPSEAARQLRDDFEHVLVDEFQDINPVQDAILRLVSREDESDRPANLFAVGDVKQSIYRFRLAEPQLFVDRMTRFAGGDPRGRSCFLPENFRSASGLIDAVNLVFERLMTGELDAIVYDQDARLAAKRKAPPRAGIGPPAELHLLPRDLGDEDADDGADERFAAWELIEREALLIGRCVQELLSTGKASEPPPLRYKDVVILLRSVRHRAPQIARQLGRLGIPVHSSVAGGFFEAIEVQDIVNLLALLDNFQQDIPLATVLRSPLLDTPLSDSDLVELRAHDRQAPFHETVRRYAERGRDKTLRQRVSAILQQLQRWRRAARHSPLATFLWQLYERTGYLSYVAALPGGRQRRANLMLLHERARRFGQTARPTLHRFVEFLHDLRDRQQDIGEAAPLGETDDVVRIMSIHKAKGLEFPVVVLADLAKRFNLSDAAGRIIFDRDLGIGPKVVDEQRMIEYPSIAHTLAAGRIERQTRAEELRLLYVAMTRARDKLIMVGSVGADDVEAATSGLSAAAGAKLPASVVAGGRSYLDWLLPALAAAGPARVHWASDTDAEGCDGASILVRQHVADEIAGWADELDLRARAGRRAAQLAELGPLPPDEPRTEDLSDAQRVLDRIFFDYPAADMTAVPAVIAASELKHRTELMGEPDSAAGLVRPVASARLRPRFIAGDIPADLPTRKGTATHALLQHLDLTIPPQAAAVGRELQRLVHETRPAPVSTEDAELIDVDSVAWFLSTPLGERIRRRRQRYHRELIFVSREPVARYDAHLRAYDADDWIMIRGIIDGILAADDGLEVVDYKTDDLTPAQVNERAEHYRTQVELYASAAGHLFGRAVTAAWLVFLTPRQVVGVNPAAAANAVARDGPPD